MSATATVNVGLKISNTGSADHAQNNTGFPGSWRLSQTSPPKCRSHHRTRSTLQCQTTEVEEAYHKVYHGIVRRPWNKKDARFYLSEGLLMICSDWFWEGPATD
jgi:hypothetical protein